ncbi:alpha/beta hydrolase [Saccharothrix deserti]|uniref:alpha/beta hydrolase n=1 Tax=Saccharothrix deserti TaxID=2593674 RepID=UPI00131E467D|nr:alpha/beta hydrolase [Saccharothrix deserti]
MTADATRVEVTWVDTTAAGRPVRLFRPATGTGGTLVWAHGGSWIGGSVAGWHEPCAELAGLSGWTVVSVEYRLAPAHPHPAALLDVAAVVGWASGRGGPVAVGGDSAGGTIAASVAVALRGRPDAPAAELLAYPPLDPDCLATSYAGDDFPTRADLRSAWRMYLGRTPRLDLSATPWDVPDLTGLPPATLIVGERDPVVDDVRAYAARLIAAGVPTRLCEFPDMGHAEFLRPGPNRLRAALAHALREIPVKRQIPIKEAL